MRAPASAEQQRTNRPDVAVVMAYGRILSQVVLNVPTEARVKAHASLLLRHRSAVGIQPAIEAADDETRITIMHGVKTLDAGISACCRCRVG